MLNDFQRRMQHAKHHYFAELCDVGCPCYTPNTAINLNNITDSRDHAFLSLPNELLELILDFTAPPTFFALISTCKRFYSVGGSTHFSSRHHERRKQKKYLACTSVDMVPRITAVFDIIDSICARAPEFVHPLHTCYNESINSSRTKDLGKSTTFPSTYEPRAWLSVHRLNIGPGTAQRSIWEAIGLPVHNLQAHHWRGEDQRAVADKKRQGSKEFKARARERAKKRERVRQEELRASKTRGDFYLQAHQKTILPTSTVSLACLLCHGTALTANCMASWLHMCTTILCHGHDPRRSKRWLGMSWTRSCADTT